MTHEEYIERVLALGYNVHFNDEVWWIEAEPFFCKPANPYQVLEAGKSRPKLHKSLLGYSYLVSAEKHANKYYSILLLNEEQLHNFEIKSLSSSKRAQVRKGMKLTEIRKIESIETVIDDIKEIEISKAVRTGYGKPVKYYSEHFPEWRDRTIKEFNADKGRKEYWGSFFKGSLIAYMKIFQIDDTMIINYAASHTDHLDKCPNDTLTFSILEYCRNLHNCNKVSYGTWSEDRDSLNVFKQKYGFKRVDFPVYAKYNLQILPIAKKLIAMKQISKFKKNIIYYFSRLRK